METYQRQNNPTRAIIGLHGWTGDEHSLRPVAVGVNLRNAKWYFPRAPYSTDHGVGYSWFSGSDEKGWEYRATLDLMDSLLKQIRSEGFSLDETYIVGFSQGASLALEYALRLPYTLGGIVPIAGFIKFPEELRRSATQTGRATPVLIMHGSQDTIVKPEAGYDTLRFLRELGNPVRLETYPAKHKIPVRALRLIRDFVNRTPEMV
ncbi:MAG: hypothetical protein GXO92_08850 [FCB group bacterium]|nr:hypothetical protein [FCB group bacterium]